MNALQTVQKFFPNVEHVKDATTPVEIEVTRHDAESKAVKDHKACAMAVACQRKLKLDGVIISRTKAYLIKGKWAKRYFVPISVSREVVAFDRGAKFMPGTYSLSAVPVGSRLGEYKTGKKPGKRHYTNPRFRHVTQNVRGVLGGPED